MNSNVHDLNRLPFRAVITGIVTAAIAFVFLFVIVDEAWHYIQDYNGLLTIYQVYIYVTTARLAQVFSFAIIAPLLAGALASYLGRPAIRNDRGALAAGILAGVAAAFTGFVCIMLLLVAPAFGPDGYSGYQMNYVKSQIVTLFITYLVVPVFLFSLLSATGALICNRQAVNAGRLGGKNMIVGVSAISAVVLLLILFSINYRVEVPLFLIYVTPLAIVLLAMAAVGMRPGKSAFPWPVIIGALGLIAVAVLPIVGTMAAYQLGLTAASPYPYTMVIEHPVSSVSAVSINVLTPLIEGLAGASAQNYPA